MHAAKLDEIDFDSPDGETVEEALDELLGLMVLEEATVAKIHADDAECLLLGGSVLVQEADVDEDLAGFIVGLGLEFDAEPTVTFVRALEVASGDGVGKCEEGSGVAAHGGESLDVVGILVVEHGLEARA